GRRLETLVPRARSAAEIHELGVAAAQSLMPWRRKRLRPALDMIRIGPVPGPKHRRQSAITAAGHVRPHIGFVTPILRTVLQIDRQNSQSTAGEQKSRS